MRDAISLLVTLVAYLATTSSACLAQIASVQEAIELANRTGRPILAVAGRKG